MQHRMLKEAQKAMVPWMNGQPIYAPISSNASSQGVPILHSGEPYKHILLMVSFMLYCISLMVWLLEYHHIKNTQTLLLLCLCYPQVAETVTTGYISSVHADSFLSSRFIHKLSCQTELCHDSHAAFTHGPAAAASSSTPRKWQRTW